MKCLKCKDEKLIWKKDIYGYSKATFCPHCTWRGKPRKNVPTSNQEVSTTKSIFKS